MRVPRSDPLPVAPAEAAAVLTRAWEKTPDPIKKVFLVNGLAARTGRDSAEILRVSKLTGDLLTTALEKESYNKATLAQGLVTVAGHPPKVLAPKTLRSILRQAGLAP